MRNLLRRAARWFSKRDDRKLVELQRFLDTFKPRMIVEFGRGDSSPVLAEYAKETGGSMVSIDHTWETGLLHRAKSATVPVYVMQENVTLESFRDPRRRHRHYGERYLDFLPPIIDLAYVAGNLSDEVYGPSVDVINLVNSGYIVRHVLFDGLRKSVDQTLRSSLGKIYEVARDGHHTHLWLPTTAESAASPAAPVPSGGRSS